MDPHFNFLVSGCFDLKVGVEGGCGAGAGRLRDKVFLFVDG